MLLRVLTYNIHKGIGGIDRRYKIDRIAGVISHYAPDLVLLQEVDDGVPRSKRHRQVDELSQRLQMRYSAFQPNVRLKVGQYGNAILSRYPLHNVVDVDLTVGPKKRRRAQVARVQLRIEGHMRTLLAINVHLGLAGFERKIQLRRLIAHDSVSRAHAQTPVVLGGDFNDVWASLGRACLAPHRFHPATMNAKTFPARFPVRPLDSIHYRGPIALDHAFAGHVDLAKQASDHLPLVADFRLVPLDFNTIS